MAVSVRFHREDPWERIRLVSAAMPNTPLSFITTGMRFISWVPADEDVMRLVFRCVVRNGIRRFQVADPSNDPPRLRRLARMAREEGVEEIVIGLTYSVSPVHTHAYYAERAAALADCAEMDRLYLKDPGGLLTPDAVQELAPHFLRAAGERTVELHSHCTIGLAPLVYMEGLRAGFQVLHTAVAPLARGTSNPAAESTLAEPGGRGLLAPPRPRGARRGLGALPRARPREGPARRPAAGVRRDVLPPPARRRDGLDHEADARRARPAGAVRRGARGGRPRARGDGLPDHRHAGLADGRDAGCSERDRRRALVERLRRDRPLLPRALRRPGRAVRAGDRRARALTAARRGAARPRAAAPRGGAGAVRRGDLRRGAAAAADDARGAGGRDRHGSRPRAPLRPAEIRS